MTQFLTPEFIAHITRDGVAAFRQHHNGIMEYTLLKTGPTSLDCTFELAYYLAEGETPQSPTLRMIVDSSRVIPSAPRAAMRARNLFRDCPNHQPVRQVWFIGGGSFRMDLFDTFFKALRLRNYQVRFMSASQRDESIQWLLGDD